MARLQLYMSFVSVPRLTPVTHNFLRTLATHTAQIGRRHGAQGLIRATSDSIRLREYHAAAETDKPHKIPLTSSILRVNTFARHVSIITSSTPASPLR